MPSRSARNNNPGNLRTSPWVESLPGFRGVDEAGFAVFASPVQGLVAMLRLLGGGAYRHLTVGQAIERYAPRSENDTANYTQYVCDLAKVSAVKKIKEMDPFELLAMVRAMVRMEGWSK